MSELPHSQRMAELRYLIGRKAKLALLNLRTRAGLTPRFADSQDPGCFEFCRARNAMLPEPEWDFAVLAAADHQAGARFIVGTGATEFAGTLDARYWHASPESGKDWPLVFFSQINTAPANPRGDVQLLWARGRLQDLVRLALLCREAGDTPLRAEFLDGMQALLHSWVVENPWPLGIHYISAMECGLRMLSVCHAADLARPWLAAREAGRFWQEVAGLVHSHAFLIEQRLSLHKAAGNHTLGECTALIYAGVLFPELPAAARWFNTGLANFEREVQVQIRPDGGNREQSFCYAALIADLCGLVTALLKFSGRPGSPIVQQARERGDRFLRIFANADGSLPAIGDSDDGFALSPFILPRWRARSMHAAPSPDDPVLSERAAVYTAGDCGYTRIPAAPNGDVAVFAHGPLGVAKGFGHGHADALSVVLHAGGHPLLVDPGTYLYGSDEKYRRYFRGTAAHNTVVVDHLDQAVQPAGTDFGWSEPYYAQLIWEAGLPDRTQVWLACHTGYLRRGVVHWRAVLFADDGTWWIWDRLTGSGEHSLALHWHIDAAVDAGGSAISLHGAGGIRWLSVTGGSIDIQRGNADWPLGWVSRRYGSREPLTTVRVAAGARLPHEFISCIGVNPPPHYEPLQPDLLRELRAITEQPVAAA